MREITAKRCSGPPETGIRMTSALVLSPETIEGMR